MPDLQDVFRTATQTVGSEAGFVDRLHRRQRRRQRNRKIGAAVLVTAVAVTLVTIALATAPDRRTTPATPVPSSTAWPVASGESFFIDLGTGETRPLPKNIAAAGYWYPVSPDGTRFAYNPCCIPLQSAVFVAEVDGTHVRRISPDGIDSLGPRWSPNGATLVYQQHGDVIGDLFVVDVDTGETTQVTHLDQLTRTSGWWFMAPTFASDGRTVLFHLPHFGPRGYVWDLWSVPVAGGEPTLVRRNAGFGTFAPNGRRLAYLSPIDAGDFSGGALYVVGPRGGSARVLVGGGGIHWPRWSPDGTKIVYAQGGSVHVVDVASGASTTVTVGGVAEWFDDDTLVVGAGGCPGC